MPDQANYRCLGVAELASAVMRSTPHRSSGALASHALEVMHAILKAGVEGGEIAVRSRVERCSRYWSGRPLRILLRRRGGWSICLHCQKLGYPHAC